MHMTPLVGVFMYALPFNVSLLIDVDTEEGTRLLCLVEFHTHAELASVIRIAKRRSTGDSYPDASKLVLVYTNGSVASVDSMDTEVFKRLYLLQSQLTRTTSHISGLNPRNHR